jgi:HD-GYP domain-containing protein (c-di-GMP phosphodiesterase class II)
MTDKRRNIKRMKSENATRRRRSSAAQSARELRELNRIGIALSETRDVDQLLSLILEKAREITSADAGSLYLLERAEGPPGVATRAEDAGRGAGKSPGKPSLRFKLTQNASLQFPFREHVLPLTETSMAGYAALNGEVLELADAYRIPRSRPYRFNAWFDEQSGYLTRSLITVPMKNGRGEVLGVLQLINCKRNRQAVLKNAAAVKRQVHPFPRHAVGLALSLASQAAVAYENSRLYRDIEKLFDGFVNAAVTAIEQRDPTTSGHSQRVSAMTVALAEAVDQTTLGKYAPLHFSADELRELRYAALLHDFGKVGVREEVLVKAKKLYPLQLAGLRDRFAYIRRDREARAAEENVTALLTMPRAEAELRMAAAAEETRRVLGEIARYEEFIARANEPTLLAAEAVTALGEIAARTYRDSDGVARPYLTPAELRLLSIARGSLDAEERLEIESHVEHSFRFLMQIPWIKGLGTIPEIARSHHEKLSGKGYPRGLTAPEIPVQAKMMTICDIYDALSASDRPYKRAVPVERALDILKSCAREEEIDAELLRVFLEAEVYRLGAEAE